MLFTLVKLKRKAFLST